jgi:RNA polymerase sigma-70 factor (ECF subfamily)
MDALMERQDRSRFLVGRAQEGDRSAFDELADRYRPRIQSLLRARLGEHLRSRVDVEDLLQEVLLRAFSSFRQFEWSEDESLFRWLAIIARNLVLEVARREKREMLLPSDQDLAAEDVSAQRTLARKERFLRLRDAINNLDPAHREVILLARIRRLPIREVAVRIGRTPRATTQLLLRASRQLREKFGNTESLGLGDQTLLDEEVEES